MVAHFCRTRAMLQTAGSAMHILRSAPCDAVFLGERTYLHSTTILPSLVRVCGEWSGGPVTGVSAQFHALTDRQCVFDLVALAGKEALIQYGYVATFKVSCAGEDVVVGLKPGPEVIKKRASFDEDAQAAAAVIDADQQQIRGPVTQAEILPVLVALNKRLHAVLFGCEGYGKWLLTRLDLTPDYFVKKALMPEAFRTSPPRQLCLRLSAVLASVNTKAVVLLDDQVIGSVQFSRKKELP